MSGKFQIDINSGSLFGKLMLFALPLIGSSLLQMTFNAADVIVVGRFAGANSLAAVGMTGPIINMLTSLLVGLSVGCNVLAGKHFGAQDDVLLGKTVRTAMTLSFCCGVILTAVGLAAARKVLVLSQAPEEVLPLAALYLRLYFAGITVMTVYNFGSALLMAVGDTRRPFLFLLVAGLVNVGLNLLFVIRFGWGVAGVAIATVLSQTVAAACVVVCLAREKGALHLDLKRLGIDIPQLKKILVIGIPVGLQSMVFGLSNLVIQSAVNTFGAVVIAGNSCAQNVEGFVWTSMHCFQLATVSFVSQTFGAGNFPRMRRVMWACLVCVVATGYLFGHGFVWLGHPVMAIYTPDEAVMAVGITRLKYLCGLYYLCGIMDVLSGGLLGMERSALSFVIAILGSCGLRIVWVMTVFQVARWHTLDTVYLSYPISWTVTLIANAIAFEIIIRRCRRSLCDGGKP